jgi:hypothetical protein
LSSLANAWHVVKLGFNGSQITATVDGKTMITATDSTYTTGMAGLLAGHTAGHVSRPYFDNFAVGPNGTKALPRQMPLKSKPLYE